VAESGSAQTFEWFLKNHLGSTMLVYGTGGTSGGLKAAYDYRSFGEQVTLTETADKVTENFTGKEKDDETQLDYFGARYLDPMLGMWISVDPKRQFASPYLYAGNGMNPMNIVDPDGNAVHVSKDGNNIDYTIYVNFVGSEEDIQNVTNYIEDFYTQKVGEYNITMTVVNDPEYYENTVYLVDKIGASYAWADDQEMRIKKDVVCDNNAVIFMKVKDGGRYGSIHEFAHLMGIKDRYTKYKDKNNSERSKPHKGFRGNVMGELNGRGLLPVQIEETLNKKTNTYENFDPWNSR
jgi:RHS repeat-associated protein